MKASTTVTAVLLLGACLLSSAAWAQAAGAATPQPIVLGKDSGFVLPSAMRYDADNDRYLVANVGAGNANDGFISIVNPDGKIETLKWIEGGANGVQLADPKGMAIRNGVLYVADLNAIRRFDMKTKAQLESIPVAGAIALDDVAIDKDGTLFVTDGGVRNSTNGGIYRIDPDGKVTALEQGPQTYNPHGIAISSDGVILNTTNSAGFIVARSPQGEAVGTLSMMVNALDGLLYLPDERIVVTSWGGRDIIAIDQNGNQDVLYNEIDTPAGLGFDSKRNLLLVPEILENEVRILPLRAAGG